jgi:4-hydroxy-3-methylbut-2-enyl diphosphate reductase
MPTMKILLANPRGFCAGVDMAIDTVEQTLELLGPPLYVYHEIVHNRHVVDDLRDKGVTFVDEIDEVPEGATVIFSAHGVSPAVRDRAKARHCQIIDATCPLVTKVHMEVQKHARAGREVILIGHDGHPEVQGTMGQYVGEGVDPNDIHLVQDVREARELSVRNPDDLAFVCQTTLSVDDTSAIVDTLRERFPSIEGPRKDDICYATQNRQDAVKELAQQVELMIVVGSTNSSNTLRLTELAERMGVTAYQIDGAGDVDPAWLEGVSHVGVTAGASAPETLVTEVVDRLTALGAERPAPEQGSHTEDVVFSIPRDLLREIERRPAS